MLITKRDHRLIPESPFASYSDYLARVGGNAVLEARSLPAAAVLEEIQRSGLRGRSGAGFPVGTKWKTLRDHACKTRFVVCNASDSAPGTFKDRWLLRKNPYSLLEGMLIAAHVLATRILYIAIRASSRIERSQLDKAIREMTQAALLDEYEVHVVEGPEDYLFGEDSALMEAISGDSPLPREAHYPPCELGLVPTPSSPNPVLLTDVETFCHLPSILRAGADSFRLLGTHDTPGTVIFTVSGDVQAPGIYELEAGVSLNELLYEHARGPKDGRAFKAVLPSLSGGAIPSHQFDTAADFGSLQLIGANLGSAGFLVFDDQASMPRLAQAVARFLYAESCNQCSACTHGLRTASHALDQLFDRQMPTRSLSRVLQGARSAPQGSRCYLPVQASVVIPSLLTRFATEFEELLTSRAPAPEPMVLPKFVDFDERTRTFTCGLPSPSSTLSLPKDDLAAHRPAGRPCGTRGEPEAAGERTTASHHARLSWARRGK